MQVAGEGVARSPATGPRLHRLTVTDFTASQHSGGFRGKIGVMEFMTAQHIAFRGQQRGLQSLRFTIAKAG